MIVGAPFLIVLALPISIMVGAVEFPLRQNFTLCRSSLALDASPASGSFDVALLNGAVQIDTLSVVAASGRRVADNPGGCIMLDNPAVFRVSVTAIGTGVARAWLTLEMAPYS